MEERPEREPETDRRRELREELLESLGDATAPITGPDEVVSSVPEDLRRRVTAVQEGATAAEFRRHVRRAGEFPYEEPDRLVDDLLAGEPSSRRVGWLELTSENKL